jgi:hypothetical protein
VVTSQTCFVRSNIKCAWDDPRLRNTVRVRFYVTQFSGSKSNCMIWCEPVIDWTSNMYRAMLVLSVTNHLYGDAGLRGSKIWFN